MLIRQGRRPARRAMTAQQNQHEPRRKEGREGGGGREGGTNYRRSRCSTRLASVARYSGVGRSFPSGPFSYLWWKGGGRERGGGGVMRQ